MENALNRLLTPFALLGLATAAAADQRLEFLGFDIPGDGRIVVPEMQADSLTGVAATVDARIDGALSLAGTEAGFIGESCTTLYGVAP